MPVEQKEAEGVGGWNKIVTLTAFQSLLSNHGILIMSNWIKYNKAQTLSLAVQSADQNIRSYLKTKTELLVKFSKVLKISTTILEF